MYKKICAQCGKEFESDSWSVICCSLECYRQRKKEQQRARRDQKTSIAQLKDFTLQKQSERIAELEAQLAEKADNPSAGELADLKNKTIELQADLAKFVNENSSLKIQIEALEKKLEKLQKKDKKPEAPQSENGLDYCERMKMSAAKLPCGERSYCWGDKKCKKNPLDEKPSSMEVEKAWSNE